MKLRDELHPRKAWIISVGTELLRGRVVNTNAAWIAEKLSRLGFEVQRIVSVPDHIDDIVEEVSRALSRADIVITTGGLGLGPDDLTVEAIARATGRELVVHPEALRFIKIYCERHGLQLDDTRIKLALTPRGSIAVENPIGAAPGIVLEHEGRLVIALPGVPTEARVLLDIISSMLIDKNRGIIFIECMIEVKNLREADISKTLAELRREFKDFYIKSYPRGLEYENPSIIIEVSASSESKAIKKYLEEAESILEVIAVEAGKKGGTIVSKHCSAKDYTNSNISDRGNLNLSDRA